jgi:hypothetical protein
VLGLKRPHAKRNRRYLASVTEAPDPELWFADKEFTSDWLSNKLWPWFSALHHLRGRPVKVLDVGSYEGRSAIAFLSYLPQSHVTCIDTFGLEDVTARHDHGGTVECRFDRNVSCYGERVTKIRDRAANALDLLRVSQSMFDVIYLDAGKGRDWYFALTALAWPLLRNDGILIWDDLKWGYDKPSKDRPGDAIRLYHAAYSSCLDILHEDRQLIARKTQDWPNTIVSRRWPAP